MTRQQLRRIAYSPFRTPAWVCWNVILAPIVAFEWFITDDEPLDKALVKIYPDYLTYRAWSQRWIWGDHPVWMFLSKHFPEEET